MKNQFGLRSDYDPALGIEMKIDSVAVQSKNANQRLEQFANEMRGLLYDYKAVWTGNNESHRILDEIECPMCDSPETSLVLPQRVRWLVDQYKRLLAEKTTIDSDPGETLIQGERAFIESLKRDDPTAGQVTR